MNLPNFSTLGVFGIEAGPPVRGGGRNFGAPLYNARQHRALWLDK